MENAGDALETNGDSRKVDKREFQPRIFSLIPFLPLLYTNEISFTSVDLLLTHTCPREENQAHSVHHLLVLFKALLLAQQEIRKQVDS